MYQDKSESRAVGQQGCLSHEMGFGRIKLRSNYLLLLCEVKHGFPWSKKYILKRTQYSYNSYRYATCACVFVLFSNFLNIKGRKIKNKSVWLSPPEVKRHGGVKRCIDKSIAFPRLQRLNVFWSSKCFNMLPSPGQQAEHNI